ERIEEIGRNPVEVDRDLRLHEPTGDASLLGDAATGVGEQPLDGIAIEEAEMAAIEEPALDVAEVAAEKLQPDGSVGDVRDRGDDATVVLQAVLRATQDADRVAQVLEDVEKEDGVEADRREGVLPVERLGIAGHGLV